MKRQLLVDQERTGLETGDATFSHEDDPPPLTSHLKTQMPSPLVARAIDRDLETVPVCLGEELGSGLLLRL
jgi:hypothetical protein